MLILDNLEFDYLDDTYLLVTLLLSCTIFTCLDYMHISPQNMKYVSHLNNPGIRLIFVLELPVLSNNNWSDF